jgi:hypothetical protein
MNYYKLLTRPDIQEFSISTIRPDIRQVKSGIRPVKGYQKRRRISGASLPETQNFSNMGPQPNKN